MSQHRLSQHITQWAPFVMIVLLVGTYAWSFVYSVLVLDSSRDLYRASQISQIQHFPLIGPDIGGFFHTGPLWFYLLAVPAAFGSLKLVALFVGILAGLKFVFAYVLGRELINRRFGLTWTFVMLLPGWQVLSQVFINHTNLLETLSLLFLLLLYRLYQTGETKYWLLSSLVLGLGFHAHPVFLVLLVFYLPVIWDKKISFNIIMLFSALTLFLMPLIPYFIDQIITGYPDWTRLTEHDALQNQIKATGSALHAGVSWWLHWLQNIKAIMYLGPASIITFVNDAFPHFEPVYVCLFGLIMFASLLGFAWGLINDSQHRKLVVTSVFLILIALLLIALLRSFTPFYMLLPITALFHGLLAFGLYSMLIRFSQQWSYIAMLMVLILAIVPQMALQKKAVSGQVNFGSVMNVNAKQARNWIKQNDTLDVLRINETKAVAEYFCSKSMVLHGPLTAVLDVSGAVPMQFYCDDFDLLLGGHTPAGYQAAFIMHRSFWHALKTEPELWVSRSWGLTLDYQNHMNTPGLSPAVFDDYVHPPRSNHVVKPFESHEFEITSNNASYLIVTNVLPFNIQFHVDKITANNLPVELLVVNAANRLYDCASCKNEPTTWRISLTTNDINAIDINTLNNE